MAEVMTPSWTTGDRMRKAREFAGAEQRQLADALGISAATLSRYETSRAEPRQAVLIAVAELCGVPLWWLMGYESAMDAPPSTSW